MFRILWQSQMKLAFVLVFCVYNRKYLVVVYICILYYIKCMLQIVSMPVVCYPCVLLLNDVRSSMFVT
jgi:hypothetical protein